MSEPKYVDQGATFSPDRVYRYRLWRVWNADLPRVAFIMLNPSTADETKLDPTLRRCLGYAQRWSCGSFEIGNVYAYRSTDPSLLCQVTDPVGPENDQHLVQIAEVASFGVIAGWGADAERSRALGVLGLLRGHGHVFRLGRPTATGQPRHPLYMRGDLVPTLHATRAAR